MNDLHRILLVEDDEDVRGVLKGVVTNLGYKPLEARNITKALMLLAMKNVDLLLLDLNLPGASGLDLVKAMHRRDVYIPTIVISGYVSASVAKELKALGIQSIVAKPFKVKRLLTEIQKILESDGGHATGILSCPGCSTLVSVYDNFCRQCGRALQEKPAGTEDEEEAAPSPAEESSTPEASEEEAETPPPFADSRPTPVEIGAPSTATAPQVAAVSSP